MNRTSKMGALFQEKMLLRKNVDYQEECLKRRTNFELFFNERTTWKSSADTYRKSFLHLKDRIFYK